MSTSRRVLVELVSHLRSIIHTLSKQLGIFLILDLLGIVLLIVLLEVLIEEGSFFLWYIASTAVSINGRIVLYPSKFRDTSMLVVVGLSH
jgi:hypothetical protein